MELLRAWEEAGAAWRLADLSPVMDGARRRGLSSVAAARGAGTDRATEAGAREGNGGGED